MSKKKRDDAGDLKPEGALGGEEGDLLRSVLTSAPIVVFAFDVNGIFTISEGRGLEGLGLKPGEVVGQSVFDIYRDFPGLIKDIQRALSGETFTSEIEVGESYFETWFSPLREGDGEINGAFGVGTDLSGQKQNERALDRKANELSILLAVSRAISSTLNLEEVLSLIAENMARALNVSGCTLSKWDQEADSVVTWVDWRKVYPEEAVDPDSVFFLDAFPATRAVLEEAKLTEIRIVDPEADPHEIQYMRETGAESLLMLPLSVAGRVIGLVELDDDHDRMFSADEIRLCQALADQAAIAIENARHYEQAQKRLKEQTALREAGAVLSSTLKINELLNHIIEQMCKAIDATSAYLSSFDSDSITSRVIAEYYSPDASTKERVSDLNVVYDQSNLNEETLEFMKAGVPVVYHVDDPELDEQTRVHMLEYDSISVLEIPLHIRGKLNATAEIRERRYRREFSQEEITLCVSIAQQAAVALEHARLFEQAQQEIRQRKKIEQQLRYDAFHDALTDLPNRALFMDRLERAILRNQRNAREKFAVFFLDLDRFKVINDSYGHSFGDRLLVEVSHRLQDSMRAIDTVARLGGDEFVILAEDVKTVSGAKRFGGRVMKRLEKPFNLDDHEIVTTASIGIVVSDSRYDQPGEYLRDADIAMYHAKAMGKDRFEIFTADLREDALFRLTMKRDMRKAIEQEEFFLQYQPITELDTGTITGFEALLRWQHPRLGLIPPAQFIPLAEETGLIVPLGYWVLDNACQQIHEWQARFPAYPPLKINVNLSGKQLMEAKFVQKMRRLLQKNCISGGCLSLEVTESIVLKDSETVALILEQLRDFGISVHMDDFGTGYSSLGYLQQFPMDVIKIDRSFIETLCSEDKESGLVRAIIFMAQEMGIKVVGEGIETPEQMAILSELGCDYGQGFLISYPLNSDAAEKLLVEHIPSNKIKD
jgi:diguanylate cyclase (GGDEF)-like protein/PAS domain S-box-containing protein